MALKAVEEQTTARGGIQGMTLSEFKPGAETTDTSTHGNNMGI